MCSSDLVWVEESVAGGASFVIELLAAPAEEAAADPTPATAPTAAREATAPAHVPTAQPLRESVLVVDDELPIRALTSEILQHAGYRVTAAATGEEALRRLEAVAYDLVVADMRMPGMDGAALYEQICERWPAMERRVIFITGDLEGERTNRRLARGDVRFLEKPFDTTALLSTISTVLSTER